MNNRTKFPDPSQQLAGSMASDDGGRIKIGVMIDGMEVVFNEPIRATPVDLDYKKKRKVVGRKY